MSKAEPLQRDAEATRERLLTVAASAFAAAGLDGVRVDQLAKDANVNKRMIYHYFGDKRGLYDAVIARAGARLALPDNLLSIEEWQQQVLQNLPVETLRLLAFEGLRLGAGGTSASAGPPRLAQPSREQQNLEEAALLFVALAALPVLCPQLVASVSGQDVPSPAFASRWQRFTQRLLKMITAAATAPKERVRLAGALKPNVR